jgi:hypothetical protein
MPLFDAIKTLAGPTHHLVFDPVHRLASFQLRTQYRSLLADKSTFLSQQRSLASQTPHSIEPQTTDNKPNSRQYGPVRAPCVRIDVASSREYLFE